MYCFTTYARSDVILIWIPKYSKGFPANLKVQNFFQIENIKTNYLSTLSTSTTHDKLKSRLLDIIDNWFFNTNRKRKHAYQVISHQELYFIKNHSDFMHK
jgi:hypothetical protein